MICVVCVCMRNMIPGAWDLELLVTIERQSTVDAFGDRCQHAMLGDAASGHTCWQLILRSGAVRGHNMVFDCDCVSHDEHDQVLHCTMGFAVCTQVKYNG